jgi:hypothetical protein
MVTAVSPELPAEDCPVVAVVPATDVVPMLELVDSKVPMELTVAVPVVTVTLPSLEAAPPVVPEPDTSLALVGRLLLLRIVKLKFLRPFNKRAAEVL